MVSMLPQRTLYQFPKALDCDPELFKDADEPLFEAFLHSHLSLNFFTGKGVRAELCDGISIKLLGHVNKHKRWGIELSLLFDDLLSGEEPNFGFLEIEQVCPFGVFKNCKVGNPRHRAMVDKDEDRFVAEISEFLTHNARLYFYSTQLKGYFQMVLQIRNFIASSIVLGKDFEGYLTITSN